MSTHTTSQMLYKLRKNYHDDEILLMAGQVSRGIYDSFYSIINKEVCSDYSSEDREVTESEKDYYE